MRQAVVVVFALGLVVLAGGCRPGHDPIETQRHYAPSDIPRAYPAYFHLMASAAQDEREGHYERAISTYRSALAEVPHVSPDLQKEAKIAAYNRIGACYAKLGRKADAVAAFQKSIQMGDRRYAPRALGGLKAGTDGR